MGVGTGAAKLCLFHAKTVFWQTARVSLPKAGCFDENGQNHEFAFYSLIITPSQKESGKNNLVKKVTQKVTDASEKVAEMGRKSSETKTVIELLLPSSFCGTLNQKPRERPHSK